MLQMLAVTFRDLVRHRERRLVELIAKSGCQRRARVFQEVQHAVVKPFRFPPHGQFLKILVSGHIVVFSRKKIEPWMTRTHTDKNSSARLKFASPGSDVAAPPENSFLRHY